MRTTIEYGTKAAGNIIDLPTAKLNSNIDWTDQDALFQMFLDAIDAEIENFIGAPIIARTGVIITSDTWSSLSFQIPVTEITKISWIDKAGTETEVSEFDFFANELTLEEKPEDFHRLKITANAGYAISDIPADIKDAALLMFSERETYREDRPVKMNYAAQNILRAYKIY